jgi:hypothetical protein
VIIQEADELELRLAADTLIHRSQGQPAVGGQRRQISELVMGILVSLAQASLRSYPRRCESITIHVHVIH